MLKIKVYKAIGWDTNYNALDIIFIWTSTKNNSSQAKLMSCMYKILKDFVDVYLNSYRTKSSVPISRDFLINSKIFEVRPYVTSMERRIQEALRDLILQYNKFGPWWRSI